MCRTGADSAGTAGPSGLRWPAGTRIEHTAEAAAAAETAETAEVAEVAAEAASASERSPGSRATSFRLFTTSSPRTQGKLTTSLKLLRLRRVVCAPDPARRRRRCRQLRRRPAAGLMKSLRLQATGAPAASNGLNRLAGRVFHRRRRRRYGGATERGRGGMGTGLVGDGEGVLGTVGDSAG